MPKPTREGMVPWPAAVVVEFRAKGYWDDRLLCAPIWNSAKRFPDKIALVDGPIRISYRSLQERVDGAAERMLNLGLVSDDRILVQLPNCWEFVVLTLACFRIGVVPVMALPAHRGHELSYLAEHSESVAIVVPDSFREFNHQGLAQEIASKTASMRHVIVLGSNVNTANISLQELTEPSESLGLSRRLDGLSPHPDAVACFLLSGGTTGLPKLIGRTHNDYGCNVRETSTAAHVTESTVYLVSLPASHNFPLACPGILGTLFAGGTVVTLSSPEPTRAFATIAAEAVTLTAVVPAVAQRWIEYQEQEKTNQLTSLEVLQVGGSRLVDELARRVGPVLGATLQQVFGMAEGLINTTRLDDEEDVIVGTQGRPVSPADEVRVVDGSGVDMLEGGRGTLLTRGPYTPRGYYCAKEHNEKSFTPDGWFITGDIVERRADGNLTVHGRDKDMINRGGEKISGEEVENLVYRLKEVDLAAAVAMPDSVLGERVCVYVTLKPTRSLDLERVRESMREAGVAAFKHPERLFIVDEMPLTKVGKIDKRQLRSDAAAFVLLMARNEPRHKNHENSGAAKFSAESKRRTENE